MILIVLSLVLALIFIIFSGFHIYWVLGGVYGLKNVIPTKDINTKTLVIPKFATVIVALFFMVFAGLYLLKSGVLEVAIPKKTLNFGCWFVSVIFILRAIGEFNFVGFFKKIKHTEFAKSDSKIFSPLCLSIGVIGVLIQFISM